MCTYHSLCEVHPKTIISSHTICSAGCVNQGQESTEHLDHKFICSRFNDHMGMLSRWACEMLQRSETKLDDRKSKTGKIVYVRTSKAGNTADESVFTCEVTQRLMSYTLDNLDCVLSAFSCQCAGREGRICSDDLTWCVICARGLLYRLHLLLTSLVHPGNQPLFFLFEPDQGYVLLCECFCS